MVKLWTTTKRISLTPHLCFIFRLRPGLIKEDNVAFFEFNRVSINGKYLNFHNFKWAPRTQDE